MNRGWVILGLLLISLLIFGCVGATTGSQGNQQTQGGTGTQQSQTSSADIASQTNKWLKVSLKSIRENNTHVFLNFELENIGNQDVKNVLMPNGPDAVELEFDNHVLKYQMITDFSNICDYFPHTKKLYCNPLDANVIINKTEKQCGLVPYNSGFMVTYRPRMWYMGSGDFIFYIKKEGDRYVSITKEDYETNILKLDKSIPKIITYGSIRSLNESSDIRICTQNFGGDDLAYCLFIIAYKKQDPKVCENTTYKCVELECKRQFYD
jgi:hypothetical protein